jgi:hypothetical protein
VVGQGFIGVKDQDERLISLACIPGKSLLRDVGSPSSTVPLKQSIYVAIFSTCLQNQWRPTS